MPREPLRRSAQSPHAPRPEFGDELRAQLRNAPWLGASIAIHGALALVFLMIPPTRPDAIDATRILASIPAEPPPELPKEPPPEVLPDPDVKDPVLRPDEDPRVIDAPKDDEISENPGDGEDDEVPAGDPFAQSMRGFEGIGHNPTIGIGADAAGVWGLRGPGRGRRGGGDGGAPSGADIAVSDGLDWLARHQASDGRWDCDGFAAQCKDSRCSGPGEATHDPGVTGLALLCFLGRGDTHQSGDHKDVVKNGLRYLRAIQDSEGCFGTRTSGQYMYDHAIATLAMVEAYGMTMSPLLKDPAQRGIDFIHRARNPYLAWRYGIRDGDNDTSVTGWMVMALKSAKLADLVVEDGAIRDAVAWVDRVTEPEFGKVGYQSRGGPVARTTAMQTKFPADQSEALTAAGVLCRIFGGEDPERSEPVKKGLALLEKKLPRWDTDAGTIDMYYWYYGTLASFQGGGDVWRKWNAAMKTAIVDHQRHEKDRCERGSWDPEDPWAPEGGRVYATALMTLSLEVYYRYPRVFGTNTGK